jgi:hypothetical protein
VSQTISFRINNPELEATLAEHLSKTKVPASTYVRELLEKDLFGESDSGGTTSDKFLTQLFIRHLPARISEIEEKLKDTNQRRILMRLLDALADFIEDFGDEAVDLMQKYQYTLELHFHKPVKASGFGPKKSKSSYSIEAHSNLKVAEDPPGK